LFTVVARVRISHRQEIAPWLALLLRVRKHLQHPAGVLDRHGLQENRLRQRKDRAVGSYAQCERKYSDDGERRLARQHTHGVLHILKEGFHRTLRSEERILTHLAKDNDCRTVQDANCSHRRLKAEKVTSSAGRSRKLRSILTTTNLSFSRTIQQPSLPGSHQ